jgi:hypothetical protein
VELGERKSLLDLVRLKRELSDGAWPYGRPGYERLH